MSDTQVKYEMNLNDLMTPKIKEADHAVNHMEGSLHHAAGEATSLGREMLGAMGIGFSLFKGFQFIEQGVEAFHTLHQSIAQVEAGLESTGEAAGLTFEEVQNQAKKFADQLPYSRGQIMDMQAQLLTFPKVAKDTFETASAAILDMATRTHRGLDEVAIMVGKALQDPEKGITAMRRVGVNFNEEQTKIIKNLVATGHAGEAQAKILAELSSEFGGSAKAAADADPLFRYNKLMGSVKLAVGEAAVSLLHYLTPALETVGYAFKATIQFVRDHAEGLKYVALAAGIAIAGFTAITLATKTWAAAQWLLNAAMSANPIGLVIAAIGVVTAAVMYAYKHFETFRAVLWGVWETVKEFGRIVVDVFMGINKVMHGVFTLNPSEISAGFSQAASAISESGQKLALAFGKGYAGGIADFAKDQAIAAPGEVKAGKKGKAGADGLTGKAEKAKATGSKVITINIKIDNLIKDFQIRTTNITEGINKTKEAVVSALLSAVNDSQIIAGS